MDAQFDPVTTQGRTESEGQHPKGDVHVAGVNSRERWWLVGAFLIVFALRFSAALWVPGLQLASDDALAYRDLAHNVIHLGQYTTLIDAPHRLDTPYALRPPLTPLSLALFYRALGESRLSECLLLAVLGAGACIAIYFLARELFGRGAALSGLVFAACYPMFFVLASVPLTESWSILLQPLLALLVIRTRRSGQVRDALLGGWALGLGALAKAYILSIYPVILAALVVGTPRANWSNAARNFGWLGGITALVLAPWVVRNYLALHAFVPVNIQVGTLLMQGSGPYAEYPIELLEQGKVVGWINSPDLGRVHPKHIDPVVEDRLATRMALNHMVRNPMRFLSLAWRKSLIFWGAYSNLIHQLSWATLALLGLIGIWLTRNSWQDLLFLYVLILHAGLIPIFFTSMPRYRAPVEPILVAFAGAAIAAALAAWTSKRPLTSHN